MQVHTSLEQLPGFTHAVITIGSFDGLHVGHRQLLNRVNRLARQRGGESVAITFDPHPRRIIYPKDTELKLLNTTAEKVALFAETGVDHLVLVPFTIAFSQLSADEYIAEFLVKNFKPSCIVIGYDHRFGLNRQGDIHYLREHGKTYGYDVIQIEPQEVENITVSSTKIRNALLSGQIEQANSLLGYAYQLNGKVVKGRQVGRSIGYPTANLQLDDAHKLIPAEGIYAARATWGNQQLEGMLYIGRRPTLDDGHDLTIEFHIFDFNRDIYGDELSLSIIGHVRKDQEYQGLEALKRQLALDEVASRNILLAQTAEYAQATSFAETAIVILNYNGRKYLETYLPPLLESLVPNSRIVIADNKSTDDSVPWLKANYPELILLELPQNYGFAGGYNEALKQVAAEIYVLLNSDVQVTKGWLIPCLELLASDPQIGAVQPKVLAQADPGKFEYAGGAGGWIDTLGYPFCRGRVFAVTEPDVGQYNTVQEVFWATGAALFIRSELFHQLGGFEAEYFAHAEEIDLCWRLKRAGYKVMAQPASTVYHVGGGTLSYNTPRKTYLNFRNTLTTSFKNEPGRKLLWWFPLRILLDGVAGGLFLVQGNWAHIRAIVQAHWHFFPRMRFWWKRRQRRKQQIEAVRIGPDRSAVGRLNESIIIHYYLLGHQTFGKIVR